MEIKELLNRILRHTSAAFTVIVLAYAFFVTLLNSDATEILLSAERIVLFFLFSLIFSLANCVLSSKSLSTLARFFIHYILSMIACYFCLILPISARPSDAVIGIALFSLLYFAALAIILLIRSTSKKIRERKEEYKYRYKK